MSHIKKITPEYFEDITRSLKQRWYALRTSKRFIEKVARTHGVSVKTVLQVKGSNDYSDYQAQNKAQHGEVKNSLREPILELHRKMFDKGDNKYLEPTSAQTAIAQISYKVLND